MPDVALKSKNASAARREASQKFPNGGNVCHRDSWRSSCHEFHLPPPVGQEKSEMHFVYVYVDSDVSPDLVGPFNTVVAAEEWINSKLDKKERDKDSSVYPRYTFGIQPISPY